MVIPIIAVFSQIEHWAFLQRILCSFIEGCVEGQEPSEWPDFEEHLTGGQAVIQGTDWGKFLRTLGWILPLWVAAIAAWRQCPRQT